ncbi:conserved hypothetical protein [Rippkaea orientalis PCC 8801]|uniref:DUF3782 domain-containing protein n=1 Tax=Rippkaea orientalis (strain PCC 8801 / RF-1) TaxID=41431 RepID=B7JWU6_RIPO1|nr:hypothetical protein [Rippkaea orientalis]ACK65795.1 conserved hypothetical protein [Rippkaea orientalis PCC 8801]
MTTTSDEVWQLLREAQKETECFLREQSEKTDRQIQQVNQQLSKLDNPLWNFIKWELRPVVADLFLKRGINLYEISTEVSVKRAKKRAKRSLEIDLFVAGDTEAILIEVKSKLTQRDVDKHLERLAKFKQFMPRYQDMNALGSVAGMIVPDEVANYAYHRGLFVLAQSGDSVIILNDTNFKPQVW